MGLTGLSFQTAGVVLTFMDVATTLSLLLSLTGIGAAAGGIIMAYRATIATVAATQGRRAAISM